MSIKNTTFNLEDYLSSSVEKMIKSIIRTSLFCPEEAAFIAKYALASKKADEKRKKLAAEGTHIPPFLITSITSKCNLHCAGCYARSISSCDDSEPVRQLTGEEWGRVFREASQLGISFILLAGGEPLVRRDVIEQAVAVPEVLFPIFTNGTMITADYVELLDKHRNLLPLVSIEGGRDKTDARRGIGVYQKTADAMAVMKKKHIAFGTSITVTNENMYEVTQDDFIVDLINQGCKAVIYVEYVPSSKATEYLAPGDAERAVFDKRLQQIREKYEDLIFISFPGDEKSSDGCLAAGRGFFHINSHGGAEPCPFSPFSDVNIKNTSLADAMNSKLFTALRNSDMLTEEHIGGCVLFDRRDEVQALLSANV